MSINEYGLDADYFIKLCAREFSPEVIRNQCPADLARAFARAARTACADVLDEREFSSAAAEQPDHSGEASVKAPRELLRELRAFTLEHDSGKAGVLRGNIDALLGKIECLESLAAARCIRTAIQKRRSVGPLWIAPAQPKLKLRHLLVCLPVFALSAGRQLDFAMLVGQVSLVRYLEQFPGQVEEADYVQVVHQREADVVDLSAAIFTARVGKEEDVIQGNGAWGQVDHVALRILPDSVEFGFDEESWSLPDSPAYQLFSSVTDHMLWDNAEAFEHWLSRQVLVWDEGGGRIRCDMAAEVSNVC